MVLPIPLKAWHVISAPCRSGVTGSWSVEFVTKPLCWPATTVLLNAGITWPDLPRVHVTLASGLLDDVSQLSAAVVPGFNFCGVTLTLMLRGWTAGERKDSAVSGCALS